MATGLEISAQNGVVEAVIDYGEANALSSEICASLTGYLREVTGVRTATRVPAELPDELVQVMRTGGALLNRVVDQAQITVTCWATTVGRGIELGTQVRQALARSSAELPLVRGCSEISGLYYDEDPETRRPRYSLTVSVTVRAARV